MHRDDLLDLNDAAEALGVGRSMLYRMIAEGELAAIKHGRRQFVEREEIAAYWERRRDEANRLRAVRAKHAAAATTRTNTTPTGKSGRRPRAAASREQPAA